MMMNMKHMGVSIVLAGTLLGSVEGAEVQAPTMERGAIIIIDGGKMSYRKAREYRRKYRKDPAPQQLRITVRELQPVGGNLYYLEGSGQRPVTLESGDRVTYFGYCAAGSQAYISFNVMAGEGETAKPFYMRRAAYSDERVARGAGTPLEVRITEQNGNTYKGICHGIYYGRDRDEQVTFSAAPITIMIPGEGETIPDAPAPEASQSAGTSAAATE